jgi:hypothetical protein
MKHIRRFSDLSAQCLLSINMESLNVDSVLDDSDFELLCRLVARENLSSDDSDFFEDGEDSIPGKMGPAVEPGGDVAAVDSDGLLLPCCGCCPLLNDNPVFSWLWGWRNYRSDED